MPSDPDEDFDVAWMILRYFARNPDAADTVEGVARWRLLDERIRSCIEQVTRALKWLSAQGLLLQDELPGSRSTFRLNKQAKQRIESLLQQEEWRRLERRRKH